MKVKQSILISCERVKITFGYLNYKEINSKIQGLAERVPGFKIATSQSLAVVTGRIYVFEQQQLWHFSDCYGKGINGSSEINFYRVPHLTHQIYPLVNASSGDTWRFKSLNICHWQVKHWKILFNLKLQQNPK